MQKPINLHIQETKQNLLNAINNSGLDLSTSSMMLNELKIAVDTKLSAQLIEEQKEYLEALEKEEEEKKKEEMPKLPKKQRIETPTEVVE